MTSRYIWLTTVPLCLQFLYDILLFGRVATCCLFNRYFRSHPKSFRINHEVRLFSWLHWNPCLACRNLSVISHHTGPFFSPPHQLRLYREHSFSIRINDCGVSFSISWREGRWFWIQYLTLIVWQSALRLRHPFIRTSGPERFPCCVGCRLYANVCVLCCALTGWLRAKWNLSVSSKPRQPLSDGTMRWTQTPPAASACLAVSLTDDTDSFTPSGSEALHHSSHFFASNRSSVTTSEPWKFSHNCLSRMLCPTFFVCTVCPISRCSHNR